MKFSTLFLTAIVSAMPGYHTSQGNGNGAMSNEEGGYEYVNMKEPSGMQNNGQGGYEDYKQDKPSGMQSGQGPSKGGRKHHGGRKPHGNNGNNMNQGNQGNQGSQGGNDYQGGGDMNGGNSGSNGQESTDTSNPTPSTGGGQGSSSDEQSLAQVNAVRAKVGAPPLQLSTKLKAAAQKHSDYQAQTRSMSHSGAGGSSPTQRINAAGIKGGATGENVAYNQANMAAAIEAWVKSPGHYRNLVDKGFKYVAFGETNKYYTQDFSSSD